MYLEGVDIPFPELRDAVTRAVLTPSLSLDDATALLLPQKTEILRWIYAEFVKTCLENGVRPVWIYLSTPNVKVTPAEVEHLTSLAREAGFAVLDLQDVYGTHDPVEVQVRPWDSHPNPLGHSLIANRLFRDFGLVVGIDSRNDRPEITAPPRAPRVEN
jgi:hypothetical protein